MSTAVPKPRPDLIDVVVAASGSLAFLDKWRAVLQPYHLVIIQTGSSPVSVPAGFDAEVHTPADAKAKLGAKSWVVVSPEGQLSPAYGYLVSKKRYVYTIAEDLAPATDPSGKMVDPVAGHLANLTSPAAPLFFNTLYDPYRAGADFVRGYPFSMREGKQTAVSHGLWLNRMDLDTTTSSVKPSARNTRYVDASLTVPQGMLYPMSLVNVAFDREAIGVAMFPGLPGVDERPVDDSFVGLCAKVVADHLSMGHKTGIPYVWRADASSGPVGGVAAAMARDSKCLAFLEELIPFFASIGPLGASSTTADAAYAELAAEVRAKLAPRDAYFGKLADGMAAWAECWKACAQA